LEEFKSGHVRILIATDVASRGLDVKGITWVSVAKNAQFCKTCTP
jgi:superfamily II DNA/RNA helicase